MPVSVPPRLDLSKPHRMHRWCLRVGRVPTMLRVVALEAANGWWSLPISDDFGQSQRARARVNVNLELSRSGNGVRNGFRRATLGTRWRLGPLMRRSKVRRTPVMISGCRRQISSKMATARMPGAVSSIGTISLSHTPRAGRGGGARGAFLSGTVAGDRLRSDRRWRWPQRAR
jgi:hypothetical protein